MNEKHTPTPWRVDEDGTITGGPIDGLVAATPIKMWKDRGTYGRKWAETNRGIVAECKANGAFIVRAVNSHDDLVAALKAVSTMPLGGTTGIWAQVHAALDLAEPAETERSEP